MRVPVLSARRLITALAGRSVVFSAGLPAAEQLPNQCSTPLSIEASTVKWSNRSAVATID